MTFETADDVLEHFGVKGMRWGVRNNRSSGSDRSTKPKRSKKKIALQMAAVSGILVAGAIIRSRGSMPVSRIPQTPSARQAYDSAFKLIQSNSVVRVSAIRNAVSSGKITVEQGNRLRDLETRDWTNALNRAHRTFRDAR